MNDEAVELCQSIFGGRLMDIENAEEFRFLNKYLDNIGVSTAYVNSWQTDDYGSTCIQFTSGYYGAITAIDCWETNYAVCKIKRPNWCGVVY